MAIRFVKMPKFIQRLYPERIWAFSSNKNTVYLTFDDGPIPEVTPWVLKVLKEYNAKATFFCIGDNIQKHPKIYNTIIAENHTVGNHTFNHLNGWKTNREIYLNNVEKCTQQMQLSAKEKHSNEPPLFRPPYGRITASQANALQKSGYKIVMWNIISYDYDTNISKEKCLQYVLKNIKPGSVIVFHDSLKAEKNLRYVLPKVLEHISEKGWQCMPITQNKI